LFRSPQRVGAPHDVIGAQALYQRAYDERGELRLGDRAQRENLAEIAIDVADAVLRRNFCEIAAPLIPTGFLNRGPCLGGVRATAAHVPKTGVINDEVQLRPILGGL